MLFCINFYQWYNILDMETKILISYLVICITYSLCRLHYLLTQKVDEEFNDMFKELNMLADDDNIVKKLVILQIFFAPITAPFSMIKQIFRLIKKIFMR